MDKENNELNIYQSGPSGRAFFIRGDLKDININFYGYRSEAVVIDEHNSYPININGLSACLSFFRSKF